MAVTVEAVYEDGVLKPDRPLRWKNGERRVAVTVCSLGTPLSGSYGIIGWTGDAETVRRVALDPGFLLEGARRDSGDPSPSTPEGDHEHHD